MKRDMLDASDVQAFPGRAEIEAALRELPEKEPGAPCAGLPREQYIRHAVDELCHRGALLQRSGGTGTTPPHYRPCSAETMTKELKELKDRAEKLARKTANHGRDKRAREKLASLLRGLHATTIEELDDAPVFIVDGKPRLPVFSDILRSLPDRLERGLAVSERDVQLVALLARHTLKRTSGYYYPSIGRLPDRQAHIIADLLATAYRDLTGREPGYTVPTETTKSYDLRLAGKVISGEWGLFVEKIFKALGLKRAVVHTVRRGKYGFRHKN